MADNEQQWPHAPTTTEEERRILNHYALLLQDHRAAAERLLAPVEYPSTGVRPPFVRRDAHSQCVQSLYS
jgi:hypothetical protein